MKKWAVLLALACMLTGCAAEETMETVADVWQEEAPEPREITVSLPDEAAAPAMESGARRMYVCQDHEILVETREGGDLQETIRALTGFEKEELTVVETEREGVTRYDFVWVTSTEEGQRLGRGVVLDDGYYHYTMTVLRDAENTEKSQIVWRTVFESFSLEAA